MKHLPWLGTGVIAIWFVLRVLLPSAGTLTHGFAAYYSAARLLQTGRISADIYTPVYFSKQVQADSGGKADDIFNANPPTTALLFWPLTFLPIKTARTVWTWLNFIWLLAGLSFLVCNFAGRFDSPTLAVVLALGMLFQPTVATVQLGQAYLLVFLLLAVAAVAFQRRHEAVGGTALALALVLKTSGWPLPFLLAAQRRWRFLGWTAATGLAAILLTLPLFPPTIWRRYVTLLLNTSTSPATCATAYQTMSSFLCNIFGQTEAILYAPGLGRALYLSLLAASLVAVLHLARKQPVAAFGGMLAWGVIFAPLGEQYHHAVVLIPLVWLVAHWPRLSRSAQITVLAAIGLYLLPFDPNRPLWQHGWPVLLAYPRLAGAGLTLLALHLASQKNQARLTNR